MVLVLSGSGCVIDTAKLNRSPRLINQINQNNFISTRSLCNEFRTFSDSYTAPCNISVLLTQDVKCLYDKCNLKTKKCICM